MKNYQVWTENVKNGPLDHDYDICQDGEITTISRSNDKSWLDHARSEKIGVMINSGDDLVIRLNGIKKPITLDYQQAHQLLCLLISDTLEYKTEIRESKTIKQF